MLRQNGMSKREKLVVINELRQIIVVCMKILKHHVLLVSNICVSVEICRNCGNMSWQCLNIQIVDCRGNMEMWKSVMVMF